MSSQRDRGPAPRGERSSLLVESGYAGQGNRRTVRKLRHQVQLTTHRLDVSAERRQKQIATLFDAGHVFLVDPELLSYPSLCLISRLAKIPKGHLFGNQRSGQLLDSFPAIFRQSFYFFSEHGNMHCNIIYRP